MIGGDLIVSASTEALAKMAPRRTRAVINVAEIPTSEFAHNPGWKFPQAEMIATLREAMADGTDFIDAQRLATALLGDGIATNLFLLGFAWQRGMVPVSEDSLMKAIALNGVAIDLNRSAFVWGRRAAHDLAAVERHAAPQASTEPIPADLDALVAHRMALLTAYQDAAYAERFRGLVHRVRDIEAQRVGAGSTRLAEAVARSYAKLLAYKDEYEVARLYTAPAFQQALAATFDGDYTIRFHLAAPLLAKPDPNTGLIAKHSFGPGMLKAFRVLAKLKRLRGTRWDLFGHTAERRAERALIEQFETDVDELLCTLNFATPAAGRADRLAARAHRRLRPRQGAGDGTCRRASRRAARRMASPPPAADERLNAGAGSCVGTL